MYLWDPDPRDAVGRSFTLRYFSYEEGREAACATTIVGFIITTQVVRFVLFGFRNANDYSAFHDVPAFIIFLSKVLTTYAVLLLFAIIFHEFTSIRRAWQVSVNALKHSVNSPRLNNNNQLLSPRLASGGLQKPDAKLQQAPLRSGVDVNPTTS